MGFQDFISETEAAHRAGVSVKTLQRFSEAGYLQVEVEPDGLRLYSQTEINEIFGVHRGDGAETSAAASEEQPPHTETNVSCETTVEGEATSDTAAAACSIDTPTEAPSEAAPASCVTTSARVDDDFETSSYALEVVKLRNVISLQEKLLDAKDAEIADLKNQREWLRARVERLEEKSDRDQILLLSETQTIRKLISLQEQKRSSVRQLLEWLGLAPQSSVKALTTQSDYANGDTITQPKRTIEVQEASNG